VTSSLLPSLSPRTRSVKAALALALAAMPFGAVVSYGQAPAAQSSPPSLSEKVSTELPKLKPLQDAKNIDGMIALLEGLIPGAGPNSYDLAYLEDMRGQLFAAKDQWTKAIQSREKALTLAEANNYFDKAKRLEMMLFISQVAYQQTSTTKVPAEQLALLKKASEYINRWMKESPKVTPEIISFNASILLQQAVADPKNVNKELLKQARVEVDKLFLSSVRPKENLYFLLLAVLQQEGDTAKSAEVLELIVKQFPTKKDYWTQLWATYLNMANDKDEAKARANFARAINTMERAQAQGFMNTPKDNFNLVSLYIQVNQFGKACDLLYDGLKKGTIENDPKNWIYLGYYYVQINQNERAIAVLKEAAKLFPQNGQFDVQIGEIYRQDEKMKEARQHYKDALRKGGLDRPHAVHTLLANVAYELEDFDEAKEAILKAETFPDAKKDGYLGRLKDAIQAAINERDAQNAAKAAPVKKS
jgi:tetratricopeptide (TPR) repeat protein